MIRDRLKKLHLAMAGYRIYLIAFLLSLPDILDGLTGFDYAAILPEGWGSKAGIILSIARVIFGIYIRNLKASNLIEVRQKQAEALEQDKDLNP